MRTLESLNILFSPLGISASRQIIGGDRDGGYLEPAICIGDRGDSIGDSWWSSWNDFMWNNSASSDDAGGGGGCGGSYDGNYSDEPDDVCSHITFGEGISQAAQEAILNYLETLPEELQMLDVKIIIDADILHKLSGKGGYTNNAAFLHMGYESANAPEKIHR